MVPDVCAQLIELNWSSVYVCLFECPAKCGMQRGCRAQHRLSQLWVAIQSDRNHRLMTAITDCMHATLRI
jgi:hypothetical protein